MPTKKKHWGIITLNFVMFFLSLTLLSGSGINLTAFGAYPLIALSLLVAYSGYAPLTRSAVAGLLCGIVLDSIALDCYCFNSVIFFLLAVLANLLAERVFNRNLKATVCLCFILCWVYYISYWLIFLSLSLKFSESVRYLLQYALPSCIYTAITVIPFYFIYKHFRKPKNEK